MAAVPARIELKTGPHILVRVVWYVFIGWWLIGIVMAIAWLAAIIVIGLPLTFYLVNRIPTVLTLRPRREQYELVTAEDGITRYRRISTAQTSLLLRIAYFVLVGWWASALWMIGSYILMLTIIGIPLGLMMVNRLPFVFSLHRGYA
jgi:uncharacterized membrane protein YccF (DUF307 family)